MESSELNREGQPNETPRSLESISLIVGEIRAQLEDGGPELDLASVVAYVDGRLDEEQSHVIAALVARYRTWNDAYWLAASTPTPEAEAELERFRAL